MINLRHVFPDGRDTIATSWFTEVFDDDAKEIVDDLHSSGTWDLTEALLHSMPPHQVYPDKPFIVVFPPNTDNVYRYPGFRLMALFESEPIQAGFVSSLLVIIWFEESVYPFISPQNALRFDAQIQWENLAQDVVE